jgi:hypothetical protein
MILGGVLFAVGWQAFLAGVLAAALLTLTLYAKAQSIACQHKNT